MARSILYKNKVDYNVRLTWKMIAREINAKIWKKIEFASEKGDPSYTSLSNPFTLIASLESIMQLVYSGDCACPLLGFHLHRGNK